MNRVILLIVVGLAAFSSAMNELNQLQAFTLNASRFIAQWSDQIIPAQTPHTALKLETVKVESCESNKKLQQSVPSIELPWLDDNDTPAVTERPRASRVQPVKLRRAPRVHLDPVQLEVRMAADAERDEIITSELLPLTQFQFKVKNRKHGTLRINPRDREMLLKTLNRSINLRIAS